MQETEKAGDGLNQENDAMALDGGKTVDSGVPLYLFFGRTVVVWGFSRGAARLNKITARSFCLYLQSYLQGAYLSRRGGENNTFFRKKKKKEK